MYCEQQGLANLADHAHIFQHWLHAKQGELSAGTDRLEQALNKIRASGSRLRTPYFFSLLIDVYSDARRYAEARQILQQNLAEVMDTGMYIYRPELLRLQGELLLAERPGQTAAAERSFQEAIVASRQQQARALELRSTISLSRLWQMQGKRRQAVQVLKALYDQFSEGFDSVDLRMARSLLDSSDHCPQAFA
jgi:adenylate cyclase